METHASGNFKVLFYYKEVFMQNFKKMKQKKVHRSKKNQKKERLKKEREEKTRDQRILEEFARRLGTHIYN